MPNETGTLPDRRDLEFIRLMEPDALPWPKEDAHLVIGAPGCPLEEKTFCDGGGWFSPGWKTYGACFLLSDEDGIYRVAPFTGRGYDPRPPVWSRRTGRPALEKWAEAAKKAAWFSGSGGDVTWAFDVPGAMCELTLSPLVEPPPAGRAWLEAALSFRPLPGRGRNRGGRVRGMRAHLLLAPVGPAGGPLREIEITGRGDILLNGRLAARPDRKPDGVRFASYSANGKWAYPPSPGDGKDPAGRVFDSSGLASALVSFDLGRRGRAGKRDGSETIRVLFCVPPAGRFDDIRLKPASEEVRVLKEETWKAISAVPRLGFPRPADLLGWMNFPDERVPRVFQASMAHLLNASVEGEARIAAANYPDPWIRDGVMIANAFQKAGLRDFSRRTIETYLENPWAGGAGPEADAPGQLLWLLHEEWMYCQDRKFVQEAWPAIKSLVGTIFRMRRLESPMLVNGHPVAWPSRKGLIRGRMDFHVPEVYVNSWALRGLASAVGMAMALGREEAREWHNEWIAYERCFMRECLPEAMDKNFPNSRDLCSIIWPCRAVLTSVAIRNAALRYFQERKWRDDQFVPEPQWRYFDIAQAHGYLWLDLFDLVWATLEWYFSHQEAPAAWAEIGGLDISDAWKDCWSFHKPKVVIPHGWVCAEMWLLLRDLIFYEDGLQLITGRGVPADWWLAPSGWGVSGGITAFGRADIRVAPLGRDRYAWEVRLDGDEALSPEFVLELPPGFSKIHPPPGTSVARNFWGRTCLVADRPGTYEFKAIIRG
ncbi:MAG: hypothetical protein N3A38_02245 [Planctomycetota bacterium]|nr:hypothetical protein [Planctomycetota bacterium]